MNDKKSQDAREYARVTAYLPFEVRCVPPEEHKFHISRISGGAVLGDFAQPPELDDKLLAQWFNMLNAKLDSIINSLSVEREGFRSLTFQMVTISGSGMGFESKKKYNKGDILEIKILLYMYPHVTFCVYGDVVNSKQDGDIFKTSVKYTQMSDDIRDEIIKFVFQRQRELLSAKRG